MNFKKDDIVVMVDPSGLTPSEPTAGSVGVVDYVSSDDLVYIRWLDKPDCNDFYFYWRVISIPPKAALAYRAILKVYKI